jgi:dihydroorotate dehydrogenase
VSLYERLVRPALFRMDPEKAHVMSVRALRLSQSLPMGDAVASLMTGRKTAKLPTRVFGIDFPNPIGLAAGYDKDGELTRVLPSLGFGFLEIGSVTLRPQPGNDKPRLFRLPEDEAIVNRMGFNSAGAEAVAENLKRAGRCRVPLGINLGLNKECPKDDAPRQYAETFRALESFGDYCVVNVSSPNTVGLRNLQERLALVRILEAIQAENAAKKPLLVKLSPDLSDEQLVPLLEVVSRHASGVIVSNTTLSREGLRYEGPELRGGLSGAPLRSRSTEMIAKVRDLTGGKLPIIGVGGIFYGSDAFEKLQAGASLVQLYTGLIYRGPSCAKRVGLELAELRH